MAKQSLLTEQKETQLSNLGRRKFMSDSVALARGSLLALSMPTILTACRESQEARIAESEFKTLSEAEALEFAAVASRIIPTDETPGANEAGVIYFIDNVLGDESRQEILSELRNGLGELQFEVATDYGASYFHLLDEAQQDELLTKMEATPFFRTVWYLTIAGMFTMPMYGGNRDGIGYDLIAMEQRPVWAPPFGFYDADYMEKGE